MQANVSNVKDLFLAVLDLPGTAHHEPVASPAHLRAQTLPLGGALEVRGGEKTDDPLRAALLVGISLALDDASQASIHTK